MMPAQDIDIAAVSGFAGSMFNGLYEIGSKVAGKVVPKVGGMVQKFIPNVTSWAKKVLPTIGNIAKDAVDGFIGASFINGSGNYLSTPGVLVNSGKRQTGRAVRSLAYQRFLYSNYKPLSYVGKLNINSSRFPVLVGSGG